MRLSDEETQLLTAVYVAEDTRQWERFERSMGISIDLAEYIEESEGTGSEEKDDVLQRMTKIPLLMAVAPEAFDAILKKFKAQYDSITSAKGNKGSGPVTQIGNLSPEAAKKLLLMAAAQAPK